jgi:muramoyltetrapeptide carboxypeptidase
VGQSDITALHLGLLAHGRAPSWAGPTAAEDFGRRDEDGGVDDVTAACFGEAMRGELEAVGFRTAAGHDGLDVKGLLWGGNLTVLLSLLGTPHWPRIKGGVLFLEDVNEQPYRVERMLLQLHQAGVLAAQNAVLLGDFSVRVRSPMDRGFSLRVAVDHLRSVCRTPILTGLPFGHIVTKLTLPVGRRVQLVVQGRDVFIGW